MTTELQIIDEIHPEIAPVLRDAILARAVSHPDSNGSNNVGGWKSAEDFFEWQGPARAAISALLVHLMVRMGKRPLGWAMINQRGSYHKRHTHGRTYQCGVYYVTPGDPAVPTLFEVPDGRALGSFSERAVLPVPGRIVLFPGSMFHSVPRYNGAEPRITVAFEVRP